MLLETVVCAVAVVCSVTRHHRMRQLCLPLLVLALQYCLLHIAQEYNRPHEQYTVQM
jgi:hypothetical protein